MNINRNNYEQYFLLYLDKELSVPEINALNLFIADNPDLKKELETLKHSIIKPEVIEYKGKEGLLKKIEIGAQLEEKLLLFLDDELQQTDIENLQLKLTEDESLVKEFMFLQQAKLTPDTTIIFKNKASLYKKEKDKVISFGWMKLAIAAVFIGFALWLGSFYLNTNSHNAFNRTVAIISNRNLTAKNNNAGEKILDNQINTTTQNRINTVVEPPIKGQVVKEKGNKIVSFPIKSGANKASYVKDKNNKLLQDQNYSEPLASNNPGKLDKIKIRPNNNLPEPYFEKDNKNNTEPTVTVTGMMQQINTSLQASVTKKNLDNAAGTANNKDVLRASFTDNNDNKENNFSLSDDEPKKGKLAGFLRKAKRIIQRNANPNNDDNNLKVANLAFTTQ